MERVDQPWAQARLATIRAAKPPYRAGFGHVGVHQPCAALVQQPADDQKASQVGSRSDWAHKRDVAHRDIWVGELPFSLFGAAGGEDCGELR